MEGSTAVTNELNLDELRRLAVFLGDVASGFRGESGDEMRYQLSRFQRLKSLKAKREALRRAHQIWLSP